MSIQIFLNEAIYQKHVSILYSSVQISITHTWPQLNLFEQLFLVYYY